MDRFVLSNGGKILNGESEVLGEKYFIVWVVDRLKSKSNGEMILRGKIELVREKFI